LHFQDEKYKERHDGDVVVVGIFDVIFGYFWYLQFSGPACHNDIHLAFQAPSQMEMKPEVISFAAGFHSKAMVVTGDISFDLLRICVVVKNDNIDVLELG